MLQRTPSREWKRQPKEWEIILTKSCYLQTKTTMRYYFTPIHYNKRQITSVVQHVKKLEPSDIVSGIVKWCNYFGKCLAVPQNIQHRVTIWPSNSTPKWNEDMCPHKNLSKMFTAALFITAKKHNQTNLYHWWMAKYNTTHTHTHVHYLTIKQN